MDTEWPDQFEFQRDSTLTNTFLRVFGWVHDDLKEAHLKLANRLFAANSAFVPLSRRDPKPLCHPFIYDDDAPVLYL